MAGFTKLHSAIKDNPLPWSTGKHPKWPVVDVSYVRDANGKEVCTVYANNSAAIAELIAQAGAAFIILLPDRPEQEAA